MAGKAGRSGRLGPEARWQRELSDGEKDAMRVMMGVVKRDLHEVQCPECKHKFETQRFSASVPNMIAASKFILEHAMGKAPVRTAVDSGKEKPKQITSVVSHDRGNDDV